MRYSEILGKAFYQIELPEKVCDLIDVHFTAASHHFLILRSKMTRGNRIFHTLRHHAHLKELTKLVARFGNFENAKDESLRDLHLKSTWESLHTMPDPRMFDSMSIDPTLYNIGKSIPADSFIDEFALLNERKHCRLAN